MRLSGLLVLILVVICGFVRAGDAPVFSQDFEKADVDKDAGALEFLVLGDGDFKVKQDGANKVLELAPTPLETYGILFGPTETEDVAVRARAFGTSSGRRFPVFAVGVNGVGGYMLRLNPAKKAVEILKGEDVKGSAPYAWTTGTWSILSLSIRKVKDGAWTVEGKAWEQGKEEPKDALVKFEETEKPTPGRCGAWGIPYSASPIRFDDLLVQKLK
ncbi:MAG TPA: hypothetical protein VEK08_12450 [Planctomycetota bacterium]|nr:hypothetical protein [Planctomycetota bacterium]